MPDGLLNKCKECAKRDVRNNYAAKRDQYASYEQARYQQPERKAESQNAIKLHRAKHPDRYKARTAVGNAIRDGRLLRGQCEKQPCTTKSEAHHDDYSKPLEVHWMCRKHHLEEHGKIAYSI